LYIFGSAGQLLRCSALSKVHVAVQAGLSPQRSPLARVQKTNRIQKAVFRGGGVKKFTLAIFLLLAAACGPVVAQTQQAIRVNCGGSAYTDAKAQVWQADYGYDSGYTSKITANVTGTFDQRLYQTARTEQIGAGGGGTAKPLIYSFPVSAGSYHVNLYFAETNPTTQRVGARVFDVKLQGNTTFPKLDVFAAAGANTALVKSADVIVTDGNITVELDAVVQAAKINAIEITQTLGMPQLNLNFVYPDGTPVAGSLNYNVSSGVPGGTNLSGNQRLNSGRATCLLISSPQLLGLVGTMNVNLSLTDTAGHSLWQIVLSLNPASANFTAVQSSSLSVVVQKQ